jgi:hypothetical protein
VPVPLCLSVKKGDGMADSDGRFVAKCGGCEGELFFFTCHHAHGTGHEWALAGICVGCRSVTWINTGCPDCQGAVA